jgi:isochorismate pyruvate lyase
MDTLAEVRAKIDRIDDALMLLFAERLKCVDRAAELKPALGVSAAAPSRAAAVIGGIRIKAEAAGFDPDVAADMWALMVDAMIAREQKEIGTTGQDR